MILILFLMVTRAVTLVPTEIYYDDEPMEYDELSEDPWMDPHNPLTTTTTTTLSTTSLTPNCRKICKKVCPTATTTTTSSQPGKSEFNICEFIIEKFLHK